MTTLNGLMGIGKRALSTHTTSIAVAGNNIANASTPGYCRQSITLGPELTGERAQGALLGSGVRAGQIVRAFDAVTYKNIIREESWAGYYGAQAAELSGLNAVFNESSTGGLNEALGELFSSFSAIAVTPESPAEREVALGAGETVVSRFNMLAASLKNSRITLDGRVKESVNSVNGLAEEIATLNLQIGMAECGTNIAGNLRDQRDELIRQLAEEADITVNEGDDGTLSISLANRELVQGGIYHTLTVYSDPDNNELLSVGIENGNVVHDLTGQLSGGNLGGAISLRDTLIPDYQGELDYLAYSLVNEFNAQHHAGFGLDGLGERDFFVPVADIEGAAERIAISSDVSGNGDAIAAALSRDGVPGDGENAILLYQLSDKPMNGHSRTFSESAIALGGQVGSDTQHLSQEIQLHGQYLNELSEIKASVSGVSIDEESAKLIEYQTAYEAAARFIGVIQEIMDTLLRM